ncbi:MAG: Hsp70 family protein [Ruminococcaceae bacterium]|nr:Hsp70 family protein [Oscillospiraceae bacterium]
MGKKVGIDLGTTYSCVSYLNENGGLEVVRNQEGNNTTPSVVFFDTDGSTVVVGENARPSAAFAPDNLVERIKSQMGTKDYTINIMGNDYSPTAISSIILRKLKEDAEAHMGEPIEGCVITCPAYFGTIAKAATLEAAKAADLNVYSIINEPTAAAFAYTYIRHIDTDKTVLIYDLGGGTFDCTLLKINFVDGQQKVNVVASNGDPFLGGKDWDDALIEYVVEEFCRITGADPDEMKNDPECKVSLSIDAEKNKKMLTARESVKMKAEFNGEKQLIEITRDTFDSVTEPLLQKTISLVNAMFAKENRSIDEVDEIILVGGSTYMPQVAKCLEATYGKPLAQFEPNEAVAKGAALMAAFSYAYDDGDPSATAQNAGDAQSGGTVPDAGNENQGFTIKRPDGQEIVVEDIINKSYGVKIFDENEHKHLILNLLKVGTAKPCTGSNDGIMPLAIGTATHITVCETDSKEDIVEYEESYDVYSGPLNVPQGLDPHTPVTVVFDLNMSGILAIKTVAAGIVTELVFDPTTGGATTEGVSQARKLQLG